MKNTVFDMKSLLDGTNCRLDTAEGKINELDIVKLNTGFAVVLMRNKTIPEVRERRQNLNC